MLMLIRLRNLTKHYTVGVEQIRARWRRSGHRPERVRRDHGLVGIGQVTMMNILGCLDRPTPGTYELDGQLVSSMGGGELGARAE